MLTPFAQVYQADLAKIGVTLNIRSMETATWLAEVNGVRYNGLYVSGDSLGNYQPATPLGASPAWSPSKNNSGFKSDEWTTLVEAVGTETDQAKQKQLYAQVNDYMIDQAWSIVFAERAVIWLARSNLKNMIPTRRQSYIGRRSGWSDCARFVFCCACLRFCIAERSASRLRLGHAWRTRQLSGSRDATFPGLPLRYPRANSCCPSPGSYRVPAQACARSE